MMAPMDRLQIPRTAWDKVGDFACARLDDIILCQQPLTEVFADSTSWPSQVWGGEIIAGCIVPGFAGLEDNALDGTGASCSDATRRHYNASQSEYAHTCKLEAASF